MIGRVLATTLALLATQQAHPLRKSDLIRLLSGSTFSQDEIAGMVRRTCLSFTPSGRDRADLTALGASPAVLREIDACGRKSAAAAVATAPPRVPPRATPSPTPQPKAPSPVTAAPVAPVPATRAPAAARTGFVAGMSQHGIVGTRLPLPLVFQALDDQGTPVRGQNVTFAARNARVEPAASVTDTGGKARVEVTLGTEARAAVVTATVGTFSKSVSVTPAAGPPAELVVVCRGERAEDRLALPVDSPTVLAVTARDAYGNAVTVAGGLRAATGDRHILRVRGVSADSTAATVTLDPAGPGSTALQLQWFGVRLNFTVTVAPGAPRRGC
ncbi:MAG TPA: Ig-like domain-containing protein [Gemmatimonadales bacterium]